MKSVKPLISLTSDITQIPVNDVEEVIDHYFQQLRSNLRHPQKPVMRIQELGRFELKPNIIRRWLLVLLEKLKQDRNNEDLKQQFSEWWKLRQKALKYHKNKKENDYSTKSIKRCTTCWT